MAKVKVDNVTALAMAAKQILPYVFLFYGFDIFLWFIGRPGPANDAQLVWYMIGSTFFLAGFFVVDFLRSRSALKRQAKFEAAVAAGVTMAPAQSVYVVGPPYGHPGTPGQSPPPGYATAPFPPPARYAPYPPAVPAPAMPPDPPPPDPAASRPPPHKPGGSA